MQQPPPPAVPYYYPGLYNQDGSGQTQQWMQDTTKLNHNQFQPHCKFPHPSVKFGGGGDTSLDNCKEARLG